MMVGMTDGEGPVRRLGGALRAWLGSLGLGASDSEAVFPEPAACEEDDGRSAEGPLSIVSVYLDESAGSHRAVVLPRAPYADGGGYGALESISVEDGDRERFDDSLGRAVGRAIRLSSRRGARPTMSVEEYRSTDRSLMQASSISCDLSGSCSGPFNLMFYYWNAEFSCTASRGHLDGFDADPSDYRRFGSELLVLMRERVRRTSRGV